MLVAGCDRSVFLIDRLSGSLRIAGAPVLLSKRSPVLPLHEKPASACDCNNPDFQHRGTRSTHGFQSGCQSGLSSDSSIANSSDASCTRSSHERRRCRVVTEVIHALSRRFQTEEPGETEDADEPRKAGSLSREKQRRCEWYFERSLSLRWLVRFVGLRESCRRSAISETRRRWLTPS
jgi:hypothetical protein